MNERSQPQVASARSERSAPETFAEAAARLRAQRPLRNRRLVQISADLHAGRFAIAEHALQEFLTRNPDDPDAIILMAQVMVRTDRVAEVERLLDRCLELDPEFVVARFERAKLMVRMHNFEAALDEVGRLSASDPQNPQFRQLKATIFASIGEDEQALATFAQLAEENPERSESWIKYGDALRVTGSREKSVAAYRQAITCRPSFGLAWWSLANLKTFCFDEADIKAMEKQLALPDIALEDRVNLLFALGKAYEDQRAYDRSFQNYAKGNAARRLAIEHDAESLTSRVPEKRAVFTREFFDSRRGTGAAARDPIFILGRPRAGSTLVEQILSSHSAIEGTAELPYMADFAMRLLEEECRLRGVGYPEIYAVLDPAAFTAFGEEYLARARLHRKTNRPLFIDKAPANYHHLGMIHLMLPNAKIIDARRHPVACCFSMFKHNYTGTNLRLAELGRVYREYVALMAHFDRVLPGRIHRVIYENLVADPEAEIRRLLDYLELPFEESCLRFHQSGRSVRSPSSEQVRRPISGEAVDHWRNFAPWLQPLLGSLGSVLAAYPEVPDELR
jgi:tetratricopeptide (TPR) repeat protein